jgi:CDP-2,3-bis-(O-geranylgeranyl)-sn-glycerol synthase
MQPLLIIQFLVLLTAANGAPVIAKKLLGNRLAFPVDAGKTFIDGRPLLGPSKTVRGIVASLLATSLAAPAIGLPWSVGAVVAASAMAGDLASSFVKRRMGYVSSSRATGLDQVPESLLPALACRMALGLTVADVIAIVVLFTVGEIALSRLLFKLHIRDQPY